MPCSSADPTVIAAQQATGQHTGGYKTVYEDCGCRVAPDLCVLYHVVLTPGRRLPAGRVRRPRYAARHLELWGNLAGPQRVSVRRSVRCALRTSGHESSNFSIELHWCRQKAITAISGHSRVGAGQGPGGGGGFGTHGLLLSLISSDKPRRAETTHACLLETACCWRGKLVHAVDEASNCRVRRHVEQCMCQELQSPQLSSSSLLQDKSKQAADLWTSVDEPRPLTSKHSMAVTLAPCRPFQVAAAVLAQHPRRSLADRRQHETGAFAKADPEAIALAVSTQGHCVAVLEELPHLSADQLHLPRPVPGQLQHASQTSRILHSGATPFGACRGMGRCSRQHCCPAAVPSLLRTSWQCCHCRQQVAVRSGKFCDAVSRREALRPRFSGRNHESSAHSYKHCMHHGLQLMRCAAAPAWRGHRRRAHTDEEMVPVPIRSPASKLQPPTVWCATICGKVQYLHRRCAYLIRLRS